METGLKPIVGENTSVLILGSFPGVKSLAEKRYYAHPQNIFWEMMEEVCGAGRQRSYEERCDILVRNRIALWDVLRACEREGSSDGRIRDHILNDFAGFFSNKNRQTVFFNGKTAFSLFTRYVDYSRFNIDRLIVLPSTSPANAGISREVKRVKWRSIAEYI